MVVGGGIAGSALAASLARHGLGTTVLEQEHDYRDRVRGEYLPAWGVAEAQRLDLADILQATGGTVVRWRVPYDEAWSTEIAEHPLAIIRRSCRGARRAWREPPGRLPCPEPRRRGRGRRFRPWVGVRVSPACNLRCATA